MEGKKEAYWRLLSSLQLLLFLWIKKLKRVKKKMTFFTLPIPGHLAIFLKTFYHLSKSVWCFLLDDWAKYFVVRPLLFPYSMMKNCGASEDGQRAGFDLDTF